MTAADLERNQGALLLSQLARSQHVYTYDEQVLKGDRGLTNLDNRFDERYYYSKNSKGKTSASLPPAGVDAAVTVNPEARWTDKATATTVIMPRAVAFHELAEAYFRVDGEMPYGEVNSWGAHFLARQMEHTLIQQRPDWTPYPAGGDVKRTKR